MSEPESDNERDFYIIRFRLDGIERFLIWYTDENDGVIIETDGRVPVFGDVEKLLSYASENSIKFIDTEPTFEDLDVIRDWIEEGAQGPIDCNAFLGAWNVFADISQSTGGNFDSDKDFTLNIYNKLFWGCNLPALTPPGKHLTPEWGEVELKTISLVMTEGIEMIRRSVVIK